MDELKTESRRIAASILFFAVTATAAIVLFILIPSQVGVEKRATYGVTSRTIPYAMAFLIAGCGLGLVFQSLILKKDEVKELDLEIVRNATDYPKLSALTKEKEETEEKLMEKMERWEYLTDLAERIEQERGK